MFFKPTKKEWLQLGVSFAASAALVAFALNVQPQKKAQAAEVSAPASSAP